MNKNNSIDTLAEFHLQHPPDAVYALIAHLIVILENYNGNNIEEVGRNISNILGETESLQILKLICQKSHVDYLLLMQDCQSITLKRISPRLLLHIICLPIPYVADQLQIDQYFATQLFAQLCSDFTIDAPLPWLKRLLDQTMQERLHYSKAKEDLLMGRAITSAPVDTAEERRIKHRLNPRLKPADWDQSV